MTYNFDPDRWYDNELAFLDHQLNTNRISPLEYQSRNNDLEARYDDMRAWLDGTYSIPIEKTKRDPQRT